MRWCFYSGWNRFIFILFVLPLPVASNTVSQLWIAIPIFHLFPCSYSIYFLTLIPFVMLFLNSGYLFPYSICSLTLIPFVYWRRMLFLNFPFHLFPFFSYNCPSRMLFLNSQLPYPSVLPSSPLHFFCFVPHLRV